MHDIKCLIYKCVYCLFTTGTEFVSYRQSNSRYNPKNLIKTLRRATNFISVICTRKRTYNAADTTLLCSFSLSPRKSQLWFVILEVKFHFFKIAGNKRPVDPSHSTSCPLGPHRWSYEVSHNSILHKNWIS